MSKRASRNSVRVLDAAAEVAAAEWDALAAGQPLLRHAFLHALEASGCVGPGTGWSPCHLALFEDEQLAGAMPLYLKDHSYGEYVFDWAWADAYHRHGLPYYPKLVCALPFTPVAGPRILAANERDRQTLLAGALALAERTEASSLHILFPPQSLLGDCERAGMLLRKGVQFHWTNPGYRSFDDFLGGLAREKRKKIRQERRRVHEQGITFRWLSGAQASEGDWRFFERCYRQTYREHHSTPYLNLAFFLRLAQAMPQNVLLIQALAGAKPIAATFNIVAGREVLYGRNWGALVHVPLLHFECCYYQAIEYCITHDIGRFEGGAQGKHKMARGLMPVETWSAHWLANVGFRNAIGEFLAREREGIGEYVDELNEHSPFLQTRGEGEEAAKDENVNG